MKKVILFGALFAVIISLGITPAFAQYMGSGGVGGSGEGGVAYPKMSLEDTLELVIPLSSACISPNTTH